MAKGNLGQEKVYFSYRSLPLTEERQGKNWSRGQGEAPLNRLGHYGFNGCFHTQLRTTRPKLSRSTVGWGLPSIITKENAGRTDIMEAFSQ